ncbi:MAG: PVC-type heme-binding CxxCH protein, partial [Planctomycetota bacterium]
MNRNFFACAAIISAVCSFLSLSPAVAQEFELRDGDRVVLLGDALIEQEQYSGWLEVMLTTAFPDRHVTLRNIGWSADTPAGDSRFGLSLLQAGREPADEGWKQLQAQLQLTKPTVLILGYGMASSLEGGAAGAREFEQQLTRLVQYVQEVSPEVRFLFLSPISQVDASNRREAVLENYSRRIQNVASSVDAPYIDLSRAAPERSFRRDAIHLNAMGYQELAEYLADSLDLPNNEWLTSKHTAALREVIVRKNEWWFHRSRPANMAYVFGFRKREQGQNAGEIPQFDALIEQEEELIAKLRSLKPIPLPKSQPQLKSKYAEFKEQPHPEFTIADGWEVSLWAENPLLNKPIQMNFDAQGRLWIASSEAYPMIEVGQSAPDRILMLEDTTGDGKADKSQVFAEGLLIPTGVIPGDGGVYVAQSTDLLFLKDEDGDGKADSKTRVLNGFGTEDTHHNLHTLRWGPDGRLYMNQSVYTRSDMETPHGVVRLKAGGGFRVDISTLQTEVFFRGLWNSWGHQFDRYGQSFLTDGAGFAGIAYSFPGASFNPAPGSKHILDLISPGRWPKFASMEIVEGDAYPKDWQGSVVTCDFRANRVTRFSITEQDGGFVTKQEADVLRTSAATFRPIDIKQGPDGALYIADWSNPIINHGEVDFRDPRRDRWHGRIWRLEWKSGAKRKKSDLTKLGDSKLLAMLLEESDQHLRRQAKRVLIERGEATYPAVDTWVAGLDSDFARLEALWLLQAQNRVPSELLEQLLVLGDARIRSAAVRCLGQVADPTSVHKTKLANVSAMLEQAIGDKHPRVRLEALRALARQQNEAATKLALEVVEQPMDRFLQHALSLTIDELAPFLPSLLEQGTWQAAKDAKKLEMVLGALSPAKAAEYIKLRLANKPLAADGSGPWIELVGRVGGSDELLVLLKQAESGGFDAPTSTRVLQVALQASRSRRIQPAEARPSVAKLLRSESQSVVLAAMQLAGQWKMRGQVDYLASLVPTDKPDAIRVEAIRCLGEVGGPDAKSALQQLAAEPNATGIRRESTVALARVDQNAAMDAFFAVQSNNIPETESLGLWRGMLNIRGLGKKLAGRISGAKLADVAIEAGIKATKDGGRKEPELVAALTPLVKMEKVVFTKEFMQVLTAQVPKGDPVKGELVYRRQDLQCATCHAIGGVGGKVGPDMTSLGASAPVDYLVESIFDPNAKIKENYHAVTVLTEDDQILTGIELDSTEDELIIRDAKDKEIRIPQVEVVAKREAQSLMPLGVVDKLSRQEQIDLIAFLSKLGKPGEFDASQGGVAREMELYAGTHRREQDFGTEKIVGGEVTQGWLYQTTRVNGDLPKSWIEK